MTQRLPIRTALSVHHSRKLWLERTSGLRLLLFEKISWIVFSIWCPITAIYFIIFASVWRVTYNIYIFISLPKTTLILINPLYNTSYAIMQKLESCYSVRLEGIIISDFDIWCGVFCACPRKKREFWRTFFDFWETA